MPALASSPQGTPITPHQPKGRDGYYSKAAATVTATAKPNEDPSRDKPPKTLSTVTPSPRRCRRQPCGLPAGCWARCSGCRTRHPPCRSSSRCRAATSRRWTCGTRSASGGWTASRRAWLWEGGWWWRIPWTRVSWARRPCSGPQPRRPSPRPSRLPPRQMRLDAGYVSTVDRYHVVVMGKVQKGIQHIPFKSSFLLASARSMPCLRK